MGFEFPMYQQVDCASDHALPNCTHLDENNQEVCVAVRAVQHVEAVNYTLKNWAELGVPVSLSPAPVNSLG